MRDSEKTVVPFPDSSAIEAEASEWIVRLDGGDASPADYAKFQEWQCRSPQHREAVQRLSALWSELDCLKHYAQAETDTSTERPRMGWRQVRRPFIYAAAACLAVAVVSPQIYKQLQPAAPLVFSFSTAVGQEKTVTLPDGTALHMNTGSRVEISFSDDRRDVKLTRGEAYFEVTHDPARPFTVHARDGLVRDIGTAFDVRLLPKAVQVTVTRGNVELSALRGDGKSPQPAENRLGVIAAGQSAVFDRKVERLELLSNAAMNRELSWRNGVLAYAGEPLGQVVDDVNRYTNVKITLGDPKLSNVRVGGYFEIGKDDAFFEALKDNFGLRVQRIDDTHVVVLPPAAGGRRISVGSP